MSDPVNPDQRLDDGRRLWLALSAAGEGGLSMSELSRVCGWSSERAYDALVYARSQSGVVVEAVMEASGTRFRLRSG
jgi:hypothetical protein